MVSRDIFCSLFFVQVEQAILEEIAANFSTTKSYPEFKKKLGLENVIIEAERTTDDPRKWFLAALELFMKLPVAKIIGSKEEAWRQINDALIHIDMGQVVEDLHLDKLCEEEPVEEPFSVLSLTGKKILQPSFSPPVPYAWL